MKWRNHEKTHDHFFGVVRHDFATWRTDLSDVNVTSFDINTPQFMANTWPRPNDGQLGGRFLHSDIKNVAYFFVHPVFRKIVEVGGLNQ